MGGISSPGIGSGLNTASIVSQLVAAERAGPENRLIRAETSASTKLSAYGSLKGQVADFASAIDGLKGLAGARKASPTNTDAVTVGASENAALGSFSVRVLQLATAQSLGSEALASRDETVGAGTLTVAVGDDAPVTLTLSAESTLADLRDALNDAELDLRASLLNDGTGERLVLQAKETGADETIAVSVVDDDGNDGDGLGLSRFAQGALTELSVAKDAIAEVNGLLVERGGNQFSDVLEGVTLTLKAPTDGDSEVITISADNSPTKAAVDKFVNAYNGLSQFIAANTGYDADTQESGLLLGDSTLRSLESTLRNMLLASTEAVEGIGSLVDLGLKTSASGTLSLEGTALDDALAADPEGINVLLDRLGSTLDENLERFEGTSGLVQARINGFEARLDALDDRRERLDRRMVSVQARYEREFSALDTLIAGMNQTSSYLSVQLGALTNTA